MKICLWKTTAINCDDEMTANNMSMGKFLEWWSERKRLSKPIWTQGVKRMLEIFHFSFSSPVFALQNIHPCKRGRVYYICVSIATNMLCKKFRIYTWFVCKIYSLICFNFTSKLNIQYVLHHTINRKYYTQATLEDSISRLL